MLASPNGLRTSVPLNVYPELAATAGVGALQLVTSAGFSVSFCRPFARQALAGGLSRGDENIPIGTG